MILSALILTLAPVFVPPNTGWVQLPKDPAHPSVTTWELPSQMQRLMLEVVPFAGTTEDQHARFKAVLKNDSLPFRLESEGTLKLCNGLTADRLTIVSTRGMATRSEHAYIVYSGKLYDLTYLYDKPLPEGEAALATLCPITP